MNQSQLLNQSIDLMLVGMGTVFSFLILLVVLMFIISKLSATSIQANVTDGGLQKTSQETNTTHKKIIKELFEQLG
jgi:Na+-transporting methylmalonyl-CoA/oxaloacetate decarboxylase gamma subunit